MNLQRRWHSPALWHRTPTSHPRAVLSWTHLTQIHNPSQLARVLLLSPPGAWNAFLCKTLVEDLGGLQLVHQSFYPSARLQELQRGLGLPEDDTPGEGGGENPQDSKDEMLLDMMPLGTVRAVALDAFGCITVRMSTDG